MATTTALDLMVRASQAPAGSRRGSGSREGATAARFEDVLRELDRAGQPPTGSELQARGIGNSGERVQSASRPAPRTSGSKAPAGEPEVQDGETGGTETSASDPMDSTVQPALGVLEAVLPTALLETGGEGTGQGPQTLPVEGGPAQGVGPAQAAGSLAQALGTGESLAPIGPEAGQGLPGPGQGEVPAAATPAGSGPAGQEVPVQEPATPPGQGSTALPGAKGPTPAVEPDLGPPVQVQAPQKEGKARPVLASAGEPGPEGLAEALLKGLASERQVPTAAHAGQAPEGAHEASRFLPAALGSELEGQVEGQGQGSPGPGPQGEGEGSPGLGARTTWNQVLEEMGFRLEGDGKPYAPETKVSRAQLGSEPGAKAGQPGTPPSAEAEPAPVQVQSASGAQVLSDLGAEGQVGGTAVEITSGTVGSSGGARAQGGAATTPFVQVGDVVVKRLQQLRNPGSDELHLELEPKELGSVKIRLELRGDGVKAHFVVDRPVVQAMLDRAMAELRQNLADQGYQVEELQVALQGDEGRDREPFGERENRAGRARGLRAGAVEAAPVREATASQWTPRVGPGRIDIRA